MPTVQRRPSALVAATMSARSSPTLGRFRRQLPCQRGRVFVTPGQRVLCPPEWWPNVTTAQPATAPTSSPATYTYSPTTRTTFPWTQVVRVDGTRGGHGRPAPRDDVQVEPADNIVWTMLTAILVSFLCLMYAYLAVRYCALRLRMAARRSHITGQPVCAVFPKCCRWSACCWCCCELSMPCSTAGSSIPCPGHCLSGATRV
eukprot:scpid98329/ scgid2290/ 